MDDEMIEKLRYPIGKFQDPTVYGPSDINRWIKEIEEIPTLLRSELDHFTDDMLDESYRQGGWTVRQVVHHLVDSHMNAYIRFKLTLTEDRPAIKPYEEAKWAELIDGKSSPVEVSLTLFEALHRRFVIMLKNIRQEQFNRAYFHPANNREYSLKTALALYAWHGKHHLGHIQLVKLKTAKAEK